MKPPPALSTRSRAKTFEMRQRNAKSMGMLDGFKTLLGPDKAPKLRPDLSKGRIFFERLLLAERTAGSDTPSPRMSAVHQVPDPGRHEGRDGPARQSQKVPVSRPLGRATS